MDTPSGIHKRTRRYSLSSEELLLIRTLMDEGFRDAEIARRTGISSPTLGRIRQGSHFGPKFCLTCGKEFIARSGRQLYCLNPCTTPQKTSHRLVCSKCGKHYNRSSHATVYLCAKCVCSQPRACVGCGKEFIPASTKTRYCSSICSCHHAGPNQGPIGQLGAIHKKVSAGPLPNCDVCGNPCRRHDNRTCGWECWLWIRPLKSQPIMLGGSCEVPWRHCVDCDIRFIGNRPHCGGCFLLRRLRNLLQQECQKRIREEGYPCKICGKPVQPWRDKKGLHRKVHRGNCQTEERRQWKHAQRIAEISGTRTHVPRVRSKGLHKLAELVDWKCYICGKEIPKRFGNYGLAPSLEHFIPISRGGTHVDGNIGCVHKACNSVKKDKLVSELPVAAQLRWIRMYGGLGGGMEGVK